MCQSIAVIPVHNEALTIAAVVQAARIYLPVLVVDDASEDGSGALAAAAGARVITFSRQRGKGEALRCGFAEALRSGAGAVVTLDGDGQHDPHDIPRLLAAAQRWPQHLIIGGRMLHARAVPRARLYAIQVVSFWINWLGPCAVRDTQSGFRLYPALMLQALTLRHGRFLFESELLLKAAQAGWPVHEIPIRTLYFPGRVSQYVPLRDGIAITAYIFCQSLRHWPLQLWRLCQLRGAEDKTARCQLWRRTGVALQATLSLPLLGLCVLTSLWSGPLGSRLLAMIIGCFYDARRLASMPGSPQMPTQKGVSPGRAQRVQRAFYDC